MTSFDRYKFDDRLDHPTRQLVAQLLTETPRTLHVAESECRDFSLFDDIRLFMQGVDKAGLPCPKGLGRMLRAAYGIEEALNNAPIPRGLCHNDLVPQNFIKTETSNAIGGL